MATEPISPPSIASMQVAVASENPVLAPSSEQPPRELEGHYFGTWILNEGLLRDEGTACGLTGDAPGIKGKRDAINAFYQLETVRARRKRTPLEAELEESRRRHVAAKEMMEEARKRYRETEAVARLTASTTSIGQIVWRQVPTLLLSLVAAGCGYVLVRDALADDFTSPLPIALAVVLGGAFTLFRPVSEIFGAEEENGNEGVRHSTGWLQHLIELAPPFVAALFTCGWLIGDRSWSLIALTGLFLFTLFLFSGKLALSTLAVIAKAFQRRQGAQAKVREAREELGLLRARVDEAEAKVQAEEQQVVSLLTALSKLRDQEEVEAIRDYKIALFHSEVAFAEGAQKQYDLVDVALPYNIAEEDDGDA